MSDRKYLWERFSEAADLATEPAPRQSLVEVFGQRRVLIENHCGIAGYGSEEICVKVRCGQIIISGSRLELSRMTREQLVVTGCVDCVRFCKGGM